MHSDEAAGEVIKRLDPSVFMPPRSAQAEPPAMVVVADDRERPSGIPDLLARMQDVRVSTRRLKTGDYLVSGSVLIERKTVTDVAASIIDTRLFRQANHLARSDAHPLFLIEGTGADFRGTKMTRESIQGALITLTLIFDVPVLRSRDPQESARIIAYAACQVAHVGRNAWNAKGRRPKSRDGRRLRLLQGLPGIGPERANVLLAKFGTVENCFRANAEALCGVPGIGPKTALEIRRLLE